MSSLCIFALALTVSNWSTWRVRDVTWRDMTRRDDATRHHAMRRVASWHDSTRRDATRCDVTEIVRSIYVPRCATCVWHCRWLCSLGLDESTIAADFFLSACSTTVVKITAPKSHTYDCIWGCVHTSGLCLGQIVLHAGRVSPPYYLHIVHPVGRVSST